MAEDAIKDLIWDAGGTLFDTYPAVVAACNAALQTFGYDAPEDWLMGLFRQTTAHGLQTVAATYGLALPELKARFGAVYDAMGPEIQAPFPYVREVCALVVDMGGRSFIITHRARASLEQLLTAHDMQHYFADCITGDDPYPRKPDPTSLHVLMARHHIDPHTCMLVGDRELDMVAGVRAGVKTCFFGTNPPDTEVNVHITGYDQLLRWLQNQVR